MAESNNTHCDHRMYAWNESNCRLLAREGIRSGNLGKTDYSCVFPKKGSSKDNLCPLIKEYPEISEELYTEYKL